MSKTPPAFSLPIGTYQFQRVSKVTINTDDGTCSIVNTDAQGCSLSAHEISLACNVDVVVDGIDITEELREAFEKISQLEQDLGNAVLALTLCKSEIESIIPSRKQVQ